MEHDLVEIETVERPAGQVEPLRRLVLGPNAVPVFLWVTMTFGQSVTCLCLFPKKSLHCILGGAGGEAY